MSQPKTWIMSTPRNVTGATGPTTSTTTTTTTAPGGARPPVTPLALDQVDPVFFRAVADAALQPPVKVFGDGASRQVFLFTRPWGGSAVVKVMNLFANEAVVAANMINLMNACREEQRFQAVAPRARVADATERVAITEAIATIPDRYDATRGTVVATTDGLLVSEFLPGVPFAKFAATEPPPKAGPQVSTQRRVVTPPPTLLDLVAEPEAWYVLGTVYVVDVVLGMRDHLIPQYNSENFLYDPANRTFQFIDNIKGSVSSIFFDDPSQQTLAGFPGYASIQQGRYGDAAVELYKSVVGAPTPVASGKVSQDGTGIRGDLARMKASPAYQDAVARELAAAKDSIVAAMTTGIQNATDLWTGVVDGEAAKAKAMLQNVMVGVDPAVRPKATDQLYDRITSLRPARASGSGSGSASGSSKPSGSTTTKQGVV